MAKRYQLRRGDVCPCCGQRILTDDPEILDTLTSFAMLCEQRGSRERADGWLARVGFEWPEEDES